MTTDLHLNTGAAALDSLPPDESAEFQAHVADCPTCEAELAGFAATVAMLASVAVETPPASLRISLMEKIKTTAQLPPMLPPGRHTAADQSIPTERLAPVIALRPWYRRPQAYLAAAAAAVVIAGGTTLIVHDSAKSSPTVASGTSVSSAPTVTSGAACVSVAPDSNVVSPAIGGGVVRMAESCKTAVVTVTGLKALPTNKAYELWVLQNGNTATAKPAGLLTVSADGSASTVATVGATDTNLAVTVEPAGGSTEPTTTPIWVATFKA